MIYMFKLINNNYMKKKIIGLKQRCPYSNSNADE